MSETIRIDNGNFDWIVRFDKGRVWVSPSIRWKDGEVYESLRDGQQLCRVVDKAEKYRDE